MCSPICLHGVLGVECSNHSVPTIFFNSLAVISGRLVFNPSDFASELGFFIQACLLFRIVSAGARESVTDTLFAASISWSSSAAE